MSFSQGEAQAFFGPMTGKTTTFIVDDRSTNFLFARATLALAARAGKACAVLDLDAFYASNSELLFGGLPPSFNKAISLQVPEPGLSVERGLVRMSAGDQGLGIIDSLNTLNHLLGFEDSRSRGRRLSFALASLSYASRIMEKAVILTMYRREGLGRVGISRSISSLTDLVAEVQVRGAGLSIRAIRGTAWPGGKLIIRIL